MFNTSKITSKSLVNVWMYLLTAGLLAAFFFFYFYVYVQNNENRIVDKRFRVLSQMSENISTAEEGFKSVSKNFINEFIDDKNDTELKELKNSLKNKNSDLVIEYYDFEGKKNPNGLLLNTSKQTDDIYAISMQYDDFFFSILNKEFFDQFIIYDGQQILHHTFKGGLNIELIDTSLIRNKIGIESGTDLDIVVSNVPYKAFLQPVLLENKTRYLAGLMETDKLTTESRSLANENIIYFFLVFLLFVFGIPLFKLYIVNEYEMITNKDVYIAVFFLLMGIITVSFATQFFLQHFHETEKSRSLQTVLSDSLKSRFQLELNKMYLQLQNYTSNLDTSGKEVKIVYKNDNEYIPSFYKNFKVAYWMDKNGDQKKLYTTRDKDNASKGLDYRPYFKNAGQWNLPNSDHRFYLESISSSTTGEKMGVISIIPKNVLAIKISQEKKDKKASSTSAVRKIEILNKDTKIVIMASKTSIIKKSDPNEPKNESVDKDTIKVAAMTSIMASVINTVLPQGFGFAIINSKGDVLFHSTKDKNLQINLFDELERNEDFMGAVYGRTNVFFEANYLDKKHRFYTQPLDRIPLTLVTFYDESETNRLILDSLFTSVFIYFIILLYGLFIVLILVASGYRKSILKKKYSPFAWLIPAKKYNEQYGQIIKVNGFITGVTIVFYTWLDTGQIFPYLINAVLFSIAYSYDRLCLTDSDNKEKRINIFDEDFIALVILQNIFFIILNASYIELILFVLLLNLIWFNSNEIREKDQSEKDKSKVDTIYIYSIISGFVIFCILPIYMISNDIYKKEKILTLKYGQTQYAKKINARDLAYEQFLVKKKESLRASGYREETKKCYDSFGIYDNSDYKFRDNTDEQSIRNRVIKFLNCQSGDLGIFNRFYVKESASDPIFINSLYRIRPHFTDFSVLKNNLLKDNKTSNTYSWNIKNKSLVLNYKRPISAADFNSDFRILVSSDLNTAFSGLYLKFFMAILVALFVLTAAYFLVRFIAKSSFGYLKFSQEGDYIEEIKVLDDNNLSFFIATGGKGKDPIKKYLGDVDYRVLDIDSIREKRINKKKYLLTDNVDISCGKRSNTEKHLDIIEDLLFSNYKLVVPIELTLNKMVEELKNRIEVESIPYYKKQFESVLQHLQKVIQLTSEVILPFTESLLVAADCNDTPIDKNDSENEMKVLLDQKKYSKEYNKLLETCSIRDKLILFDLAEDRVINTKNEETINDLLKKRILKYCGSLNIFSESFRNYLLTNIPIEEMQKLMGVEKTKGNWSSYKAPIVLVTFTIIIFLAFQKNLMDNLGTIVTAALGGLTIFTRFSGFFTTLFKGEDKNKQ